MNRADCIHLLQQHGATEAEAKQIVDALLEDKRKVLAAGGNIQQLSAQWSERAQQFAKETQRKEYLKALGLLRYSERAAEVDALMAQGASAHDAIRTLLAGQSTYREGGRQSVSALREGIYHAWAGGMLRELEGIDGAMQLIREDEAFHDAVFREMREPGTSQDTSVQQVADIFARYMEQSRLQLNDAGAYIGKIEDWTPQNHDPYKIASDPAAWKKFVLDRLDVDRSFPGATPQQLDEILDRVRQDILTGKPLFLPQSDSMPHARASSKFEHHRVLHFKDADAALEYHKAYGRGNIFTAMVTHLDHAARSLALLQRLGPNPWDTLTKLVGREDHKLRHNANLDATTQMESIEKLRASLTGGSIRNIMREVTGEVNAPVNPTAARIMSCLRMWENMSKLGAATLSALADPFIKASAIRTVTGKNWFQAMSDSVRQYLGRLTPESRDVARQLGSLLDHLRLDVAARWDSDMGAMGRLGTLQEKFFKWSGLDWITERGKAAYNFLWLFDIGQHGDNKRRLGNNECQHPFEDVMLQIQQIAFCGKFLGCHHLLKSPSLCLCEGIGLPLFHTGVLQRFAELKSVKGDGSHRDTSFTFNATMFRLQITIKCHRRQSWASGQVSAVVSAVWRSQQWTF
ncbi:MAG: hypothetical protein IJU37_09475 [Desulfovibrio sp.]|nr:hypothetical protein [Desulfovibrio sp.]